MGLRINPAPASFSSPAVKNIESSNEGTSLATEKLIAAVNNIHIHFQQKGYYDAIRSSDLYSRGNADNAKQ